MNKTLTEKVKAKCKDMGLSEEYLNGVTKLLGGSIADDSTDEKAIEDCANQIMEVAKASQGEATRWAQKQKPKPEPPAPPTPQTPPAPQPEGEPEWFKAYREQNEQRMKSIEDENNLLKQQRTASERQASITAAFDKYNVPTYLRQHLAVPEDVTDIDAHVAKMAQDFVTHQLPQTDGGQKKVASKEETEAAANAFFAKVTNQTQK